MTKATLHERLAISFSFIQQAILDEKYDRAMALFENTVRAELERLKKELEKNNGAE